MDGRPAVGHFTPWVPARQFSPRALFPIVRRSIAAAMGLLLVSLASACDGGRQTPRADPIAPAAAQSPQSTAPKRSMTARMTAHKIRNDTVSGPQ